MTDAQRTTSAIAFIGTVGLAELAQRDRTLAKQLIERLKELERPIIAEHHGREIMAATNRSAKTGLRSWIAGPQSKTGPLMSQTWESMLEFHSCHDAILAAVAIQSALREYNKAVQRQVEISVRIGIHLGEIIQRGEEASGSGINIASRIEPFAEPGGICVSEQVSEQIKNKLQFPVVKIGSNQLKNVQLPVEIYRVELPWEADKVPSEAVTSDRNRLVILPFKSLSADPNDEYFADGMTEELITALSHIRGLDVIARTTAMHYKGGSKRASDIGKELRCRSLLEGSVRKAGNKVRISVQLVRAQDEAHLWTKNYDKQLDDIFAVQSDIGRRVARALKVRLFAAERQEPEKGGAPNVEAYTLYLKGMSLLNKISKEALGEALNFFERSIEIDPRFALGFSGLAGCHFSRGSLYSDNRVNDYKKGGIFVLKALELDDKLAEAHATLAQVLWRIEYDLTRGEEELRKAIELEPSCVDAHIEYTALLLFQQRPEEAHKECMRVVDLDPLSPWTAITLGVYYSAVRDYNKAIEQYKKSVQAAPNDLLFRFMLFRAYCLSHKYDEALSDFKQISPLPARSPESKAALLVMHSYTGQTQKARNLLSSLDERDQQYLRLQPFFVGVVHFQLDEVDEGFKWLERAVDERDRAVTLFLTNCEELDGIRSDPRYHALLRKVNLK